MTHTRSPMPRTRTHSPTQSGHSSQSTILIGVTFGKDRSIDRENHPALLRLLGNKQSVV